MSTSASNKATLGLLGIGAALIVGTAAAKSSNRAAAAGTPAAPYNPAAPVGIGGGGGVVAAPKPPTTTPKPAPVPPVPVVSAGGVVPAGPDWAQQPAVSGLTISQRVQAVERFLSSVRTAYYLPRMKERGEFAAALVMGAELEKYPLDLVIGHSWAESGLTPCMRPTAGSGAYGPLQVSAITCSDVGMSYPPADMLTAVRVGIRYMRKCRAYGALNLTDGLRMYGLGPGNLTKFNQLGCSGKPCERAQSVWRHECGCSGADQRYTWKINRMARRAAAAGLHSRPWADWTGR